MNYKTIIGNATKDGKLSPNGKFYEVTIADSPPPPADGKEPRYVTNFILCSLFVDTDKGQEAPVIKKGQRCIARGWEGRRDWVDKKDKTKRGTEMELRCELLEPLDGRKVAAIAAEERGDKAEASAAAEEKTPGKGKAGKKATPF